MLRAVVIDAEMVVLSCGMDDSWSVSHCLCKFGSEGCTGSKSPCPGLYSLSLDASLTTENTGSCASLEYFHESDSGGGNTHT